ncbi:hypothetical protein HDU98_008739 [Podochytrium sp. JEL0797]|nr:hypothetical protein HDU98_008739 [Podochytrium sp. JEL0797]
MTDTLFPRLFSPINVAGNALQHRIVLGPMTRHRALARDSDGNENVPSDLMVEYYSQRASAGGLLITEATCISPETRFHANAPGIYSDAQIRAWKKVTNAVHRKGAVMFVQLRHSGFAGNLSFNKDPSSPPTSSLREIASREGEGKKIWTHELSVDEIREVTETFVQAAKNAIEAGFDGVELHGTKEFLIEEFINDSINKRTDDYGGSIANRLRFPMELITAVSAAIGPNRTAIRLAPYGKVDGHRDSTPVETYTTLLRMLNPLNIAYVNLLEPAIFGSRPIHEYEDLSALNLDAFRQAYHGTVILGGGYTAELANEAVETHRGDLVSFARAFSSNPDLPERIKRGWPLTPYDRETMQTTGAQGYVDFPAWEDERQLDPTLHVMNEEQGPPEVEFIHASEEKPE